MEPHEEILIRLPNIHNLEIDSVIPKLLEPVFQKSLDLIE